MLVHANQKAKMKVGYCQYDVKRDREENLRLLESLLPTMKCDLIVLPELCLGGYLFTDEETLARQSERVPDGPSVKRMMALSGVCGCAIVYGMAEQADAKLYNTAVVVDHGRFTGRYRKIHLTDYEKRFFNRGDDNPVFDLGTCRIGVQICFDLWFPEVSREQLAKGAEVLCALANFGGETTCGIARTRAIENLTPLVLCNRIGAENLPGIDATFLGKSALIDRDGKTIRHAEAGHPAFESGTIAPGGKRANVICADFPEEIALHHSSRDA